LGFSFLDKHRRVVFVTLSVLAAIVSGLSIIPVASLSVTNSVVKNTFWTSGKIDGASFYIGIRKVVYDSSFTGEQSFLWKDDECTSLFVNNQKYCDECESACSSVMTTIIMNMIVIVLTITTNLKRSTREGDINFTKGTAIFSGIFSSIVMMFSLSTFNEGCFYNLPETSASGSDVTYSLGPGFIFVLIPQLFKLTEALINLCTPVGTEMLKLEEASGGGGVAKESELGASAKKSKTVDIHSPLL
jgi:hypothetical protein